VAAAVCLSTFIVMLALTVFQARIAAEQMRLEQLDRDIAAEQSYSTRLRLAVAQAQTPEQAALRAQAEGLQLPENGIEIYASPALTDVVAVVTADASSAPAGGTP
jgi:cell division protein FtsL